MSNKLSLDISKIESVFQIGDKEAQRLSGGAFQYFLDDANVIDTGSTNGVSLTINVNRPEEIGITNTDANAADPNADGHNFLVTFFDANGRVIGNEDVRHGTGLQNLDRFQNATRVQILQGVSCIARGDLC